ncbi:uncharacterized protein [Nicotiana sylvestris]|uniref:uncharacterized protein n=1 Tax=Nicotiana sylvestris TaxID=4096 RepID=UPI00388CB166
MKRKIDSERREPKKEKNLVLKVDSNDSSEEDSDMAYLTKRFQKMVRRNGGMLKRGSSSKSKNYDLCHKCGRPGHFIKDFPLLKQEFPSTILRKHPRGASSMMVVESEKNEYDSTFALMAQSDDDEDDHNNEDALTLELGEAEQTRDDLVVCVVDLKETICELEKEKNVLTKKIANIENERDNLVVVVVDHKVTIDNFSKEKEPLVKRVTEIEEERDDLLVVVADLRETIEGLGTESKLGNTGKGKEVASEEHIRLENELKAVRTSGENRQGIGLQREKTLYNPHIKYVTAPDNWLCTHCGNNGHFKEKFQARVQSIQKNKVFAEKGTVKGSSQQWFMDSGCSKHMTGNTMDFLSLKALQGGSVSFGNGKKSLLSVSQICDKGNKVEFLFKICTVTNLVTGDVVLVAKRYKNIYVADFKSLQSGDLSCLKAVDDDAELWHIRLGHTSFSLLNKLIQKDLVHGLPMSNFKVQKVCDVVLKESM